MARTNIEETAWSKFHKIGQNLKVEPLLIAGRFAAMWHESQDEQVESASGDQIAFWMGLGSYSEAKDLIHMGVRCCLFEALPDDHFTIVGNKKHIEAHQQRRGAAAAGGRATKNLHLKLNEQREAECLAEPGPYGLAPGLAHEGRMASPIQFNSIQYKEEEEKKIHSAVVVSPPPRKRKQQPVEFKTAEELKAALAKDSELLDSWRKIYPDEEFRKREVLRAWEYYRQNGKKRPTTEGGWKRAVGSWFEKGWRSHVSKIPSNGGRFPFARNDPKPVHYPPADEVLAQQERDRDAEDVRHDPAAASKIRDLLAKAGNFGKDGGP